MEDKRKDIPLDEFHSREIKGTPKPWFDREPEIYRENEVTPFKPVELEIDSASPEGVTFQPVEMDIQTLDQIHNGNVKPVLVLLPNIETKTEVGTQQETYKVEEGANQS